MNKSIDYLSDSIDHRQFVKHVAVLWRRCTKREWSLWWREFLARNGRILLPLKTIRQLWDRVPL